MMFLSSIFRVFGIEPDKPPYNVADIYRDLRSHVLNLKPAEVGEKDDSTILAVVMETGFPEGAYTLVATIDGSASLYLSNGGGTIGAGGHPEGSMALKALISDAAKYVGKMTTTKDTPFVMPGMTTFYVVTGKGIMSSTAKENDFEKNRHALSPLFYKAHELISVIRAIDAANPKKTGSQPGTKIGHGADDKTPEATQPPHKHKSQASLPRFGRVRRSADEDEEMGRQILRPQQGG